MSKISYNSLKSKCASLGFTLSKTPFGIYQVTAKGEHGCTFDGTFREVWAWVLGYDFCKQAMTPPILGNPESMEKYWESRR